MLTWFHTRVQPHIDTKADGFWYSLAFGTLLGSARNGDTIDWDGDIDLAVPQGKIAWLHQFLQDAAVKEDPPYVVRMDEFCGQDLDHPVPCVPVLRLMMSAVNQAHIDIWSAVFDSQGLPMSLSEGASPTITHPVKITDGAFPLQECALGRKQFPCFAQKDKFLENWYGDAWNRVQTGIATHALLQSSSAVESPQGTGIAKLGSKAVSKDPVDYGHPSWLSECKSIYLDVGSNIGVQVRKFYEAEKYPNATILPLFDKIFGPPTTRRLHADESGLCVLGFEPNPIHLHRLQQMETAYEKHGWHVHFYPFAVWREDEVLPFNITEDPKHSDWGAAVLGRYQSLLQEHTSWRVHKAQGIDFSTFLASLPPQTIQFMKMDIEGAEYDTLARMLQTDELCRRIIPLMAIEAHPFGPPLRLWSYPRGVPSIRDRISHGRCHGDVPTEVSSLDDESYLLDVDSSFG